MLDSLQAGLEPIFASDLYRIANYGFALNPIAMAAQTVRAVRARDLSGVSMVLLGVLLYLQLLMALVGIEAGNAPMALFMAISACFSAANVIIVSIRRRAAALPAQ